MRHLRLPVALLVLLCAPFALPARSHTTDSLIQFYQSRAARDPDDFLTYTRLGATYAQKARESGDVTYYELAEQALQRALELGPDVATATTATSQLGLVHLARHRFEDARAAAERALGYRSGQLAPYAVLGDAYVELGDYDRAAAAYAKLQGLTGSAYPHSRVAHLQFLRGDPAGAIQALREGVEALTAAGGPGENLAWMQARLGEIFFQVGDLRQMEAAYREALSAFPGYHRASAGLARARAAQRRYDEAIELYRKALGVIPLPEYATALGDVYAKLGQAAEARKQYDLVEYIGRLNALNQTMYNRELALFYADHGLNLPLALELAERELNVRQDVYTHDVLAWARHKNGKTREALASITEALKLGTKDARLFFHAAMIHHGLGNIEDAKRYLRRTLATNPHFHILLADMAGRTLKELEARPARP